MNILNEINNLLPLYTIKLPFNNLEVQFTPFKVKDLKNLSLILQEDNKKLSFLSMLELLKTTTKLKPNELHSLCLADAEYLFLHIRSKSVEETMNLIYKEKRIKVNIADIKSKNKIQNKTIKITDQIKIDVETPTIKKLLKLEKFEKEQYINSCIKKISVKNEIYDVDKFVPTEIKEIIDNLPINIIHEFEKFILNEPELYMEIDIGEENKIKEVSGILNFFIFR